MTKQQPKLCDFSCKYADFAKDAYCSDNITMYCKKMKTMVRKFSPCLLEKKSKKAPRKK